MTSDGLRCQMRMQRMAYTSRITFTQNEKKITDNAKPSIVCYRFLIVVLLFTFKKIGQ